RRALGPVVEIPQGQVAFGHRDVLNSCPMIESSQRNSLSPSYPAGVGPRLFGFDEPAEVAYRSFHDGSGSGVRLFRPQQTSGTRIETGKGPIQGGGQHT